MIFKDVAVFILYGLFGVSVIAALLKNNSLEERNLEEENTNEKEDMEELVKEISKGKSQQKEPKKQLQEERRKNEEYLDALLAFYIEKSKEISEEEKPKQYQKKSN